LAAAGEPSVVVPSETVARHAEDPPPDDGFLGAYGAAGKAAEKLRESAAAERTARRELTEWKTQLADVRFQIEQIVASSGKTHESQASDFDRDRREIAALEDRRGALWQKLIGLASSLSGARA
jgi:hypothetical protein